MRKIKVWSPFGRRLLSEMFIEVVLSYCNAVVRFHSGLRTAAGMSRLAAAGGSVEPNNHVK